MSDATIIREAVQPLAGSGADYTLDRHRRTRRGVLQRISKG
jgi:hypothetical protein